MISAEIATVILDPARRLLAGCARKGSQPHDHGAPFLTSPVRVVPRHPFIPLSALHLTSAPPRRSARYPSSSDLIVTHISCWTPGALTLLRLNRAPKERTTSARPTAWVREPWRVPRQALKGRDSVRESTGRFGKARSVVSIAPFPGLRAGNGRDFLAQAVGLGCARSLSEID